MSACDSKEYSFLTEEELKNCYEDELTENQIEKRNERARAKIDKVLKANIRDRRRSHTVIKPTVKVVLLGKTGYGKSSTANLLCGEDTFETCSKAESCTAVTQYVTTKFRGSEFRIVDTPGLFDTKRELEEVKLEAAKCVDLCDDGVHVFLYVYNATTRRFTREELASIEETKKLFGPDIVNFAGIVLTHTDRAFDPGQTINDYINTTVQHTPLETFIKKDINYRIVGVNNAAKTDYEKEFFRNGIFDLIYEILDKNKLNPYVSEDMEKAKRANLELEKKRQAEIKAEQDKHTHMFRHACKTIETIVQRKTQEYFGNMSMQQLQMERSDMHRRAKEQIQSAVKLEDPANCKQIGNEIIIETVATCVERSAYSAQEAGEARKKHEKQLAEAQKCAEATIKKTEQELSDVVWKEICCYIRRINAQQARNPTQHDYETITQEVWNALSLETRARKTRQDVKREVINQVAYKKDAIIDLAKEINPCFPCGSEVITRQRGPIMIEKLQLGDEVLTLHHGTLKYESVVFFSHAEPDVKLLCIMLNVGNDHVLVMSPEHLVHVGSVGNLKQASEVREGDVLFVLGDEELTPRQVTSVSTEWRTGAYCPHTTGGSLVVNGVLASCYTSIIPPSVAHMLLFPIRVIHKVLPSSWFKAMIEYDKTLGMPTWLVEYRKYFLK